jgi:hypothetical protein
MELKEKSSANVTMATSTSSAVKGLDSTPIKNKNKSVLDPSILGGISS